MSPIERFTQATAAYPVTVVYISASLMLAAAVQDTLYLVAGLLGLGLISAVAVTISMYQETLRIGRMFDAQHAQLVARCEQLSATLTAYGHDVPPRPVYPEER